MPAVDSEKCTLRALVHRSDWGEAELLALLKSARRSLRAGTKWPSKHLIEYFPGEGPLVLTVPHDGTCRPRHIPRRKHGCKLRDTGTKGVAARVALEIVRRGHARPHLLLMNLSRSRVDVNRSRDQAADDQTALEVWDCYHELLKHASQMASLASARHALCIDFHCQGHFKYSGLDVIELGTLTPSASDLQRGAAHLECRIATELRAATCQGQHSLETVQELLAKQLCGLFSMPRLAAVALHRGDTFSELLFGPTSLGALLGKRGYMAVPSPDFIVPPEKPKVALRSGACFVRVCPSSPSPRAFVQTFRNVAGACMRRAWSCLRATDTTYLHEISDREDSSEEECQAEDDLERQECIGISSAAPFFSGGYTTQVAHELLDTLQIESPVRLTKRPASWAALAEALLDSLQEFWQIHLNLDLCSGKNCDSLDSPTLQPSSCSECVQLD